MQTNEHENILCAHTRIKSTSYSCKELKQKTKKLECIKQKKEDKIAIFPKGNNCFYCII